MEDQTVIHHHETPQPRNTVSFPGAPPPKKKNIGIKIAILVALLIVIGAAAYLLIGSENPFAGAPSPTPTTFVQPTVPVETPAPTPMTVSKDELSVQIQNGTGVPGEAALLQKEIEALGFTKIETANADNKNYTKAQIAFSSRVSDEIKAEVTSKINQMYQGLDILPTSSAGTDIQIITGVRTGQKVQGTTTSATPTGKIITATPTGKASTTPATTGSTSKTPTPTGGTTSSPTPTAR